MVLQRLTHLLKMAVAGDAADRNLLAWTRSASAGFILSMGNPRKLVYSGFVRNIGKRTD